MTRDNITPWTQYQIEEWERLGIILDPDPRTADEEPWSIPVDVDDTPGWWLGAVMLAMAFALGLAVGWVLR